VGYILFILFFDFLVSQPTQSVGGVMDVEKIFVILISGALAATLACCAESGVPRQPMKSRPITRITVVFVIVISLSNVRLCC